MVKKFIPLFLFGCLFIAPLSLSAESVKQPNLYLYTEAQLIELIAKLQKQLAEIRANTSQCILAEVDLSVGDGEDAKTREYVKAVQSFLREKGYLGVEPTGYFGKLTRQAVVAFQAAQGLPQTGEVSSAMRTKVKEFQCIKKYIKQEVKDKKEEWKEEKRENPVEEKSGVSSISLTVSGKNVFWSTVGYSKSGYKIVWSKNTAPTYPTREGDAYIYLSNPSAKEAAIHAFAGPGVYSVRVCEYLGGKCGIYSNEGRVTMD